MADILQTFLAEQIATQQIFDKMMSMVLTSQGGGTLVEQQTCEFYA
jgi:hypothetical protein